MSWEVPPGEAAQRWHRGAAERDAAYLAQGPADDSESSDPCHPWREGDGLGDAGH